MKLYETLGVAQNATQADIKAAYRKKIKDAHPLLNSQYIEELMRANNGAFISGGFDFGRGA